MSQDLERRASYVDSTNKEAKKENLMLRRLLVLQERSRQTREKVFKLLDWVNPMSYIRKWRNSFRSKMNDTLGGILGKSAVSDPIDHKNTVLIEDTKVNETPKSDFESAENEHMDQIAEEFFHLQNNYRQQLKHRHEHLRMRSPELEKDRSEKNNLMNLAEKIATKQAQLGRLEHTDENDLKKNNIDGENLVSGFKTAREALQSLLASPKHHQYLTGDFSQVGYAIKAGTEKRSGKKMYFLVVLFRNGKAQGSEPPTIPIPGAEHTFTPSQDSLEGWIGDRKHLQVAFKDLEKSRAFSPSIELEYNKEATQQLQSINQTKGMFVIRLKKNGFYQDYSVSDAPPLLQRVEEIKGQKPQVFEVEFADLLTDFAELSEKHKDPSPTTAEEGSHSLQEAA